MDPIRLLFHIPQPFFLGTTLLVRIYTTNKHQKYIENAEDLMSHFNFMKNVDSISKFREFVKTADFWADSASISILEEVYNFKIIILESDNYHNGEYSNILQCGDMVPDSIVKSNEFKQYYYIIEDHKTKPIPH